MTDIINLLADIESNSPVAQLRARRPEALDNAQLSFEALLEPDTDSPYTSTTFSIGERYAVAAYVAGVMASASSREFYTDLLSDEEESALSDAIRAAAHIVASQSTGPYQQGDFALHDPDQFGSRMAAALDWAHLLIFHPKDASPAAIGHLHSSGWSDQDIVSLSQLIAFLSFQIRVATALSILVDTNDGANNGNTNDENRAMEEFNIRTSEVSFAESTDWEPDEQTLLPDVIEPKKFVAHTLGWKPWLQPLAKDQFTDVHYAALIKPERIHSEYFRLLAYDPLALEARTKTDLDIFYNTDGGLGRAERELIATVVSRYNGCEFCASVHQKRSKEEGGDAEAINRLLDEGIGVDLGSSVWNTLKESSLALTATPVLFNERHIVALRNEGLDDLSIIDFIYSASFFNWANRLMLTLGTPDVPPRFR